MGAGDEFAVFQGHENAAFGADGVEREIESDFEEAFDGFERGEFTAGANKGVHAPVGAFEIQRWRADGLGGKVGRVEPNDKRRVGAHGYAGVILDEFQRARRGLGLGELVDFKFEDLPAGDNPVTGEEPMLANQTIAIKGRAVFAAKIANNPGAGGPFKRAMLAGKHGVRGHGKTHHFRTAHDKWRCVQADWPRLPVGSNQQDLGFDKFWHTAKLYCESIS